MVTRRHAGACVAEPTEQEAADLLDIRVLLEPLGAARAAQRRTEAHLKVLRGLVRLGQERARRGQGEDLRSLGGWFHETLAQASGSPGLIALLTQLRHKIAWMYAVERAGPARGVLGGARRDRGRGGARRRGAGAGADRRAHRTGDGRAPAAPRRRGSAGEDFETCRKHSERPELTERRIQRGVIRGGHFGCPQFADAGKTMEPRPDPEQPRLRLRRLRVRLAARIRRTRSPRGSDGLRKLLEPLGDQLRQPVERGLGAVRLGGEHDLLAALRRPGPAPPSMEAALTGCRRPWRWSPGRRRPSRHGRRWRRGGRAGPRPSRR